MMLNEKLIAAREDKGWTQADLAEKLEVTPVTISRWENGVQSPRAYFVSRLCRVFDMSAAELGLLSHPGIGLGSSNGAPEAPFSSLIGYDHIMHMKRREVLSLLGVAGVALILPGADVDWDALQSAINKPIRMNMRVVQDLQKITEHHWSVFLASASKSAILDGVLGEMRMLTGLLNDSHPQALHKPLCRIASELGQLAGEIFFDLNDYHTAQSCYTFAASAAKEGGHYDLWACSLIRHAYPLLYEKDFQSALLLLQGAQKAAARGDSSLVTRYWAAAVQAEAQAGIHNFSVCQQALDGADEVRHCKGGMNGTWLRFDDTRLAELRGTCLVRLEQPLLAIPVLQEALAQLPAQGRRRGLVLADLAQASLQMKKIDQACGYASQVVDLALQGSGVLRKNAQVVRAQLVPFSQASSVKQLDRLLAQLN